MASDKTDKSDKEDKSGLSETLKKVFSAGVSAAFMTEEGIRKYVADLKLPKELLEALLSGANKSKDDLTTRVAKEINGIISKIDWVQELSKFAESHKFKIKAEIEIEKKNKA
jgi:predicted butyrate kinase (DUF1464 family)